MSNEPVAWYVRFDSGRVDLLALPVSENRRTIWESAGKRFTVTPLYTHPAPDDTALLQRCLNVLLNDCDPKADIITALRERLGEKT